MFFFLSFLISFFFFPKLILNMSARPYRHLSRGKHTQDQVKPDVGEDTPGRCDEEHPKVFDFSCLTIRNHINTQGDDDEHVEGSTAHDGAGT